MLAQVRSMSNSLFATTAVAVWMILDELHGIRTFVDSCTNIDLRHNDVIKLIKR